MEINKQIFMDFVSKAFDEGASISIHYYKRQITEDDAKEKADEFAQITGGNAKEVHSVDYKSRWYTVDGKHGVTLWHSNSHDKKCLKELLEKELAALHNDREVRA